MPATQGGQVLYVERRFTKYKAKSIIPKGPRKVSRSNSEIDFMQIS